MIRLTIPVGIIIGFVYVMKLIGDYSENPFEGLHNDISMLAICRQLDGTFIIEGNKGLHISIRFSTLNGHSQE